MREIHIPNTLEELQAVLITGYHEAATDMDLVYNMETAEQAIRSTAEAIIECLAALPDDKLVEVVRHIASTTPRKKA